MAKPEVEGRRPGVAEPAASRTHSSWPVRAAIAFVLAVLALFALRQVSSPDIGFHLEAGNHILAGHGWPRTDPFTYTVTHRPYTDTSWGYQVLIALVERAAGATGLVLLHVGLALALLTLATLTARLVPGELRVLLPVLLLGGLAAEPRFEVRPELLSYALLALVLYLLQRRAEGLWAPLGLLPPVFLVWTNAHGLFVLGWAALACFVVGTWLRRRRPDLPLIGWAAGAVAAGLVNPYGWRALAFPFELATRMSRGNVFARNIGEFASPLHYLGSDQLTFYLVPIASFCAYALLVVVSLPSLWRQKRYSCVLLGLVFLPLALVMVRNVPPLVVACLPGVVFGLSLDRALDAFGLRGWPRRWLRQAVLGLLLVAVCGLGLRICTDAYYVTGRRLERFGPGWNELALPIEAAEYAKRAKPPGRMLNHLNFGGWLLWATDEPVFIDGRLEVMGEKFYEQYRSALDSPAGLEAAVRRWGIGWIVFPYRLRPDLLGGLSRVADWELVHVDLLAAVFAARGSAPVDESVGRLAAAPAAVDLASLPGLGGPPRPTRLATWRAGFTRRQRYPSEPFNRGVFHFHRGEAAHAAAEFARAILESGGAFHEMYNNLGSALAAAGRLDEARACYRLYLDELPAHRHAARRRAREHLEQIEGAPR